MESARNLLADQRASIWMLSQFVKIRVGFPLILALLLVACSELTGPDTGSIRAKVLLEGQTDHSGVWVSLYFPAELGPEIVALNRKYPHIGVPISQQTEFDPRLAREVARTRTRKEGSFELKEVGEGDYIVVAQKEGYGDGMFLTLRSTNLGGLGLGRFEYHNGG